MATIFSVRVVVVVQSEYEIFRDFERQWTRLSFVCERQFLFLLSRFEVSLFELL